MQQQRTISRLVSTVGIGVHSGRKVQIRLRPAAAGTGILFIRSDLPGATAIRAHTSQVTNTVLNTSISEHGATVSCVEHLQAALWGLGIDNIIADLDSEEVPILDGSASPFLYLLQGAGIAELDAPKEYIRIREEITVRQDDSFATIKPFEGFKASYTHLVDHPVYNRYPDHVELTFTETTFADEISRARSFGLVRDLEQAQAMGKCLGSSLDNAVGIDDYKILNDDGLRYPDEFVKHKLLDAIGDLYLLGYPILGEFIGHKSGHTLNNKLTKALLQSNACEKITLDAESEVSYYNPFLPPIAA